MATYNLIRNAYFDSLTTSGTGSMNLSWTQLESLMDGVTTSGGVTLTSSGILFLEVDLSQRIKVDEIRLYANDLGQSAYINFYYKDAIGDSYALLATQSGSYYYATISNPSAPRYIRATISGVAITLYEFEVLNDDYIVAFGEDGAQYAEYLGDTPIGEVGDPQAIAIFNNGTGMMPADAYVCIDYTGNVADEYVKISASENGTYYGIYDGVLMENDQQSSEYRWGMGSVGSTLLVGDVVFNLGKATQLPLISKSNFTNSSDNCWDYDRVNGKLYIAASDSTIKLYELDLNSYVWNYLGELYPGVSDSSTHVSIGYINGYIYAVCNATATGPAFGRFDLITKVWTTLASPVITSAGTIKYNSCSDYNRYIYLVRQTSDKASVKYFGRYDTVSGTWGSLNTGFRWYGLFGGVFSNFHMWYDTNRDRLYAITASIDEAASGENRYIQIYYPSTNSWADLLYVYGISAGAANIAFSYDNVNDSIWLMFASKPNTIYKYSLSTTQLYSYTINYTLSSLGVDYSTHIIAVPTVSGTSGVLVGNVSADRTYVYHYHMIGKYTTPIFQLEEANNSSYFLVDGTAVSGTGSISYDSGSYNGTIRTRSSNTVPATMEEVYIGYRWDIGGAFYRYLAKYDVYTGTKTVVIDARPQDINWATGVVDRRSGKIIFTVDTWSAGPVYMYIYDRNLNIIYSLTAPTRNYMFNVAAEFDNVGGLWGYSNYAAPFTLFHLYSNSVSTLAAITDGTDFLYGLAAEWNGTGVWYTDKSNNFVRHRNSAGTLLQSIVLPQPRAICSTTDNGCWVIDNTNLSAYRYTSSGTLSQTVSLGRTASRMTFDYNDGFWYISGLHIYHVTSNGVEDVDLISTGPMYVHGTRSGCAIYDSNSKQIKFINYASKSFTKTWTMDHTNLYDPSYISCLSVNLDDCSDFWGLDAFDVLPMAADQVWGTVSGSLAWQEVRKDGYFLPKAKYQQVEVTLRGDATLEKILMPPAIKVQDIASQTYKDMYIKTDIPIDADITDYEARLKTWWGVND